MLFLLNICWGLISVVALRPSLTTEYFNGSSLFDICDLDSRRYVKSRSDQQLRHNGSASEVSACRPEDIANGMPIVPCGLIAWSLFNDTYSFAISSRNLTVNKREISWKSDRDHKFGRDVFPRNFQSGGIIGGAHLNESIPVS